MNGRIIIIFKPQRINNINEYCSLVSKNSKVFNIGRKYKKNVVTQRLSRAEFWPVVIHGFKFAITSSTKQKK